MSRSAPSGAAGPSAVDDGGFRLICTDFDGTLAEPDGRPIASSFFQATAGLAQARPRLLGDQHRPNPRKPDLRTSAPAGADLAGLGSPRSSARSGSTAIAAPSAGSSGTASASLMHTQLFASVGPVWKLIEDFVAHHTGAELVADAGSPLGIIARSEEEADEISAYIEPVLANWPMLVAVRNSIYFRFSHKFYHKGACLEAISQNLGINPGQVLVAGDHLNDLPMLDRRYARYIVGPANSVDEVKARISAQGGCIGTRNYAEGVVEAWDQLLPMPGANVELKN